MKSSEFRNWTSLVERTPRTLEFEKLRSANSGVPLEKKNSGRRQFVYRKMMKNEKHFQAQALSMKMTLIASIGADTAEIRSAARFAHTYIYTYRPPSGSEVLLWYTPPGPPSSRSPTVRTSTEEGVNL